MFAPTSGSFPKGYGADTLDRSFTPSTRSSSNRLRHMFVALPTGAPDVLDMTQHIEWVCARRSSLMVTLESSFHPKTQLPTTSIVFQTRNRTLSTHRATGRTTGSNGISRYGTST